MDDSEFGTEDRRGLWKPKDPIRYPDVFVWPPQITGILKWLPKYLFPWGIACALLALAVWTWAPPSVERMQTLSAGWPLLILLRNAALIALIVAGQHDWLNVRRAQGHIGFDRVVTGENSTFHLPYYAHYLHHRLFEVNHADGSIPLDKWFGSFHDGSAQADEALSRRRRGAAA